MAKENLDYTLVRPDEIRRRFTEFVMRNEAQALAEHNLSVSQSMGFFNNESTMRQSSHRNAERTKRSQRRPPSLKKSKDPEMGQRLKKSQQASARGKLKGKHQNRDLESNEMVLG